jgi:hypothetical protein
LKFPLAPDIYTALIFCGFLSACVSEYNLLESVC